MKVIEIPEFPTLRGQDAIDALNEMIKELEEQKGKELTEKQAKALIMVANQLITSVRAEMHSEGSDKHKLRRFSAFEKFENRVLPRFQFFK
jgi:ribosomal protein L17